MFSYIVQSRCMIASYTASGCQMAIQGRVFKISSGSVIPINFSMAMVCWKFYQRNYFAFSSLFFFQFLSMKPMVFWHCQNFTKNYYILLLVIDQEPNFF